MGLTGFKEYSVDSPTILDMSFSSLLINSSIIQQGHISIPKSRLMNLTYFDRDPTKEDKEGC